MNRAHLREPQLGTPAVLQQLQTACFALAILALLSTLVDAVRGRRR